jgi:hypothetical protein
MEVLLCTLHFRFKLQLEEEQRVYSGYTQRLFRIAEVINIISGLEVQVAQVHLALE